jgi:translation elongation factor EF-1alpha
MSEDLQPIGRVTHYFNRINVAVIKLEAGLALGDWIHFYHEDRTNFVQQVESMQIDRQPIEEGYPGDEVAVQVVERVKEGDIVYPYTE